MFFTPFLDVSRLEKYDINIVFHTVFAIYRIFLTMIRHFMNDFQSALRAAVP